MGKKVNSNECDLFISESIQALQKSMGALFKGDFSQKKNCSNIVDSIEKSGCVDGETLKDLRVIKSSLKELPDDPAPKSSSKSGCGCGL